MESDRRSGVDVEESWQNSLVEDERRSTNVPHSNVHNPIFHYEYNVYGIQSPKIQSD